MDRATGNDAFLGHVPHFLLWLAISFVVTGCGAMVADALELRQTHMSLSVAASSVVGMMIATLVVHG
jgi:hypothetical protein